MRIILLLILMFGELGLFSSPPNCQRNLCAQTPVAQTAFVQTAFVQTATANSWLRYSTLLIASAASPFEPQQTDDEITSVDVTRIRQLIPQDDEQQAAELEAVLKRVEANIEQAASYRKTESANENASEQVEQEIKRIEAEDPVDQLGTDWESEPLVDLENRVNEQVSKVSNYKALSDEAASSLGQRIAERRQIREAIIALDRRMTEAKQRLASVDPSQGVTSQAAALEVQSQIQSIESESAAYLSRLNRMDREDQVGLPTKQNDFLRTRYNSAQENLEQLQAALSRRRSENAAETERQTRLSQLGSNPLLTESFDENIRLAEENKEITQQMAEAETRLSSQSEALDELIKQFDEAKTRVHLIGSSGSVGAMLRNQKSQLPSEVLTSFRPRVNGELDEVQFQLFEVQKRLGDLSEETIRQEIRSNAQVTDSELENAKGSIAELTQQRRELLTTAEKNYLVHFKDLLKLEAVDRRLDNLVSEYRTFINERILWIRSNHLLLSSIELDESDRSAFSADLWTSFGKRFSEDVRERAWIYLLALLIWVGLFVCKPMMRRAVDELGIQAVRGSCATFWPTFKSLALSSLISITFPLVPLFLGWRVLVIGVGMDDGVAAVALGRALLSAAWFVFPVELLRRFCRKAGLAHKHFDWSNDAVTTIKTQLSWFSPLGFTFVFGVAFFYFLDPRHQTDLVERLLFIVGMILLAIVLYRCLHPKTGVFRTYLRQHEDSWANQLGYVWFGCLLLVPIALGLLTIIGYYYTSLNLATCVFATFVFGLILETIRALLLRFILVRRRRAHIELAQRRREAARKEAIESREADGAEQGELAAAVGTTAITEADLMDGFIVDENALQSRKLIGLSLLLVWFLGMWLIWTDVLPALRALDEYPVWPPGATATASNGETGTPAALSPNSPDGGASVGASASEPSDAGDQAAPTRITIRDVLIFFMIAAITFVLARNLPGLIEMTFLNHLPVEPSVRYASKMIFSYLIIVLGTVLAFRSIRIGWTEVQWLATALTFGLAFGLQEIFANFVAGIILLFERPIRIGDVVTVDDVTGVVTRIRTRATTISNWDRKEYVIPNREFITGRVLNWTLSDKVNRIVIQVGIAYGSDISAAKEILYDICQNHPKTMEEPSTNVTFENFGDSALLLTVRTFVPDVNSRLTVIDQLHTDINEAFEAAGIEISFPQMDLHVRDMPARSAPAEDPAKA